MDTIHSLVDQRNMSFGGMKMNIGKPGTKYGLHRPNAAKAKPVASVFGDADEEVGGGGRACRRAFARCWMTLRGGGGLCALALRAHAHFPTHRPLLLRMLTCRHAPRTQVRWTPARCS
jgi:hypothetical protein